jgi:hypothetical protein
MSHRLFYSVKIGGAKVGVRRDSHNYDSSSSGLRGRSKKTLTILKRAWSANSKMVR